MTRVLMGDFDAIHRLGLEDILNVDGVHLVTATGRDIVEQLVSALPDVVVLDLDKPDTPNIVGRITATFPAVRVVACSSERPRMQVYPPRHYGEYYSRGLEPEELAAAVQS
jgi:DNA-binding NarL/FixJ family response regulator